MNFKKYLLSLILFVTLLGGGVGTSVVMAQGATPAAPGAPAGGAVSVDIPDGDFSVADSFGKISTISDEGSFRQYMLKVLNFFLSFVGIVATAMVIYGGYLFVVSNGDDSQKEKGQNIVIYACIGILIILASYALVNTILSNAGQGTGDGNGIAANRYNRGTGHAGGTNTTVGGGSGSEGRKNDDAGRGSGSQGGLNQEALGTGHQGGKNEELIGTGAEGLPNEYYFNPGHALLGRERNPDIGPGTGIEVGLDGEFLGGGFCFTDDGQIDITKLDHPRCEDMFGLNTYRVGNCFDFEGALLSPLPVECEDLVERNELVGGQCFDENGFFLPLEAAPTVCEDLFEKNTSQVGDCFDQDGFLLRDRPGCEDYFKKNTLQVGDCYKAGRPSPSTPGCGHLFVRNTAFNGECYDAAGQLMRENPNCEHLFIRNPKSDGPGLGQAIANPIRVSGRDVNDFGDGVVVPLEVARDEGVEITIDASGQAEIDFGDGVRGFHDIDLDGKTLPERKRYGKKGVYNLQARIEDQEGFIQNFRKRIIVGGATADIVLGGSNHRVGDKVKLQGVRSTADVGTIIDYAWRCEGDEGCFEPQDTEDIEVIFSAPGAYTVHLEVETSIGARDTTSVDITVKGNRPVAAFECEVTGDPRRPAQYQFDATQSFDTEGRRKALQYVWDFDGETIKTNDPRYVHEFDTSGTKDVTLQVIQSDSTRQLESDPNATKTITVESIVGCEVFINSKSIEGIRNPMIVRGENTNFSVESPQASNFEWTFVGESGQTYTEVGRRATFAYGEDRSGINVGLRAFDDITDDERDCSFNIEVRDKGQPKAIIDVDYEGDRIYSESLTIVRGDDILLSSSSVDDSGTRANLRETWKVNGRVVQNTREINRYFDRLGTYQIELVAANRDNANLRDIDRFTIQVINRKPEVLSITQREDGRLGLQHVRVDAQARDEDGTIVYYMFQVIDERDGKVVLAQRRKEDFAYFNLTQFPGRFQYRFRVIVTDNDGGTAESSTDIEESTGIEIDNFAPEASIYVTPSSAGTVDTIFGFAGQGTDEDGDALTYQWEFPDGTWSEPFRNYRFTEVGNYNVRFTVSDGLEEATTDVDIKVVEKADELIEDQNIAPTAAIHAVLPSTKVPVNRPVYFYSRTNDVNGDALIYDWNFGDGNRTQVQHSIHTYVNEGTYPVTLTVSDGLESVTDQINIEVVSEDEAARLNLDELNALRNRYENDGTPLTEAEKAELLVALENQVEIGTAQNYKDLSPADREAIKNAQETGSYTNPQNLTQEERNRLQNLLDSPLGSYTDFDNLDPLEREKLRNALGLGAYRDFENLPPDEREAITNLVATGAYQDLTNLSDLEKKALENVLRTGAYQYVTEMSSDDIARLRTDLQISGAGGMTNVEIQDLIDKLSMGDYANITPQEWEILQNKALLANREGLDLTALRNAGYTDLRGNLNIEKLRSEGHINARGALDLDSLRNGGFVTQTGEIGLESLRKRGFTDGVGNLDLDEFKTRGFINTHGYLDMEALRNPALLGYGADGLPNARLDISDNAFVYTQLKPKIEANMKSCYQAVAQAQSAADRQAQQKTCDQLDIQEKRAIDTLSAVEILKLEALIEEDPFIKTQIKKRVAKIEAELEDPADFEFVSIAGSPSTTFFLYGVAPDDYPRALSFEWNLGDGRTKYGQNISVKYPTPGIYRIAFTVSDGALQVSDFLRVHVLPRMVSGETSPGQDGASDL